MEPARPEMPQGMEPVTTVVEAPAQEERNLEAATDDSEVEEIIVDPLLGKGL